MGPSNQLKNQHLLWRAGFGPGPEHNDRLNHSPKQLIKHLFNQDKKTPPFIQAADPEIEKMVADYNYLSQKDLTPEQKKMIRDKSREGLRSINLLWLNQMVNSDQQLREKMSLFWHGHFASRNISIIYQQQLLDVIRRHATSNFGELLRQVSKSAAIINFLNNNQNKKGQPNENFAREVMELFTMGRGNYTETDVKEAARAFTGWGAKPNGEFVFRKNQHDEGSKTVLGKTGNFNGDDVLNILLEKQATATFITRKIYRYFVNDQPDENHVSWLANRFYQSNYDIAALMHDIFSSQWFYEPKNIGTHIKSPVELIVGIRRTLNMKIVNEEVQITLQRLLGQQLFYPPNVAGWPGGKNWIDSSTLMLRMRIPQLIYTTEELRLKPKDDDDQMMGMREKPKAAGKKGGQIITATVDWASYLKSYEKVPREKLTAAISEGLLQTTTGIPAAVLNKFVDAANRENFIKTTTIQLMSTPEYQLC